MANLDSHKALLNQLKDPFEPRLVKWRKGGGQNALAYIDARDVMKRLDDVLGVAGWQDKYIRVDGGFICEISVKIGDDWITKSNAANDTKIESVKGGASSALKRAAVNWGIGRYLYYMPSWCNKDNVGDWPEWAKPGSNLENWEDIAEMEAESDTGIDEWDANSVVEGSELVWAAKDEKELNELVKSLGDEQASSLADDINAKRRELFHASRIQSDTSQPSAKK